MMWSIASELEAIINHQLPLLRAIPGTEMALKQSPAKWSKKEIVGHIIDSAQSNIRRFIVAQYENEPKIVYDQNKWVTIAGYQNYALDELINLWYSLNKHTCNILKDMPEEMAIRTCETGAMHTIEWLAQDYIKHLRHHMHVVLELEPVAYP